MVGVVQCVKYWVVVYWLWGWNRGIDIVYWCDGDYVVFDYGGWFYVEEGW